MFIRTAGDNIRIEAEISDKDGTKQNASTIVLTVKDPSGVVKVNGLAMTSAGTTGDYYYLWQSAAADAAGTYTALIDATVSTATGREKVLFELRAP